MLPTTAGDSQSFPEVIVGGGVAGEVLTRSGVPADDKTKVYGCPKSHISHTVLMGTAMPLGRTESKRCRLFAGRNAKCSYLSSFKTSTVIFALLNLWLVLNHNHIKLVQKLPRVVAKSVIHTSRLV